ncbi:MAG: mycofactocin precursor MftA [Solirubrobacteraceae bacterium]|jgi:mycofactocin precursor
MMHTQTQPTNVERDQIQIDASPSATVAERPEVETEIVIDDLLVEDVSIDGMCGVY